MISWHKTQVNIQAQGTLDKPCCCAFSQAQMVAMPRLHTLGGRHLVKLPRRRDLPNVEDGEGKAHLLTDEAKPHFDAPLPQMVDTGLSEELIWTVIKACNDGGYNILLVLLNIKKDLQYVSLFPALEEYVQQMIQGLMDSCKTKEHAQTILSPIEDDLTAEDWPAAIPKDPVTLALQHSNKTFIAHAHVSVLPLLNSEGSGHKFLVMDNITRDWHRAI